MTATLEEVLEEVQELRSELRAMRLLIEMRAEGPLASEDEVDDKYGDPVVRFDPKTWRGAGLKGKKYSQCPPDFLEQLARALTAMAAKDDADKKMYKGKPASTFGRKDAARARRWAFRKRTGWTSPEPTPPTSNGAKAPGASPFSSNGSPFGAPASPFSPASTVDDPYADHGDAYEPPEADEQEGDEEPI